MRESTYLRLLRCLGLVSGLLCLLAGCGGSSGSSDQSGAGPRTGQLSLQMLFAAEAGSPAPPAGLAAAQGRQVQPGEPGFLDRIEVRLHAQGTDLVPPQVFPLSAADQETVTREVTVPDTVPATFEVLVAFFNTQGLDVFRGTAPVARGQTSAVVPLVRAALVPIPATPANLEHATFQFPEGTAFGLGSAPVTLATGTFVGNVGDFALLTQGFVASGQVVLASSLCTFLVTTSALPAGQSPQVGDRLDIDPCQMDAIDQRLIATDVTLSATPTTSTSSPPVPAPPEGSLTLPSVPPTLVTDEDRSGTVQVDVAVRGPRPGTTMLALTTASAQGTATLTPSGLVTYQPAADFSGSDRLVVTVILSFTDNALPPLLLGTVPIDITVRPVNDAPVVTSPGDQTTPEGMTVALPIGARDVDGDRLSFSATGLPPGLSIDPATGVIGGTIAALAASGSPYSVVVTVTDGTASPSISFSWLITQTNRPPTLANPGGQTTLEGTAVNLGLQASDPDGTAVTFSATNLPPGLSLNATTGVISGTVAAGAAAGSPYSVTATVADGVASVSQTFTWTITPVPPPTLSALAPSSGPTTGGTAVTLTGTGFQAGATVTIGGTAATNVSVVSATRLTATTPVGTAGPEDVVVTNPDGQSVTLAGGFTYVAPPPPSGPLYPGQTFAVGSPPESVAVADVNGDGPPDLVTANGVSNDVSILLHR